LVVELPELDPLEPELEPLELPMPLLEPELGALGVLGAVVELLPLEPPLAAPPLDLLKWASHSERETCPSLLVSTAEKLGAELLLLAPLEPDAAGDDEDLSLLVLLDELCARATLDSANKAAAVAALITLSLNIL
jgi:hypothetical protein